MEMNSQRDDIKASVIKNIKRDMASFGINEEELKDRISVKLDVDQFNSKEDESVWLQKKNKAPFVCEVYFDDVWMCDLHETYTHSKMILEYFKGFQVAYDQEKIRLNKELGIQLRKMEEEAKKQADLDLKKSIEALPSSTPEEKASKEIVKEMIKEKDARPNNTTS